MRQKFSQEHLTWRQNQRLAEEVMIKLRSEGVPDIQAGRRYRGFPIRGSSKLKERKKYDEHEQLRPARKAGAIAEGSGM